MRFFSSKALLLPVAFVALFAFAGCEDEDFKAPRDASTVPDSSTMPIGDGSVLQKDADAMTLDAGPDANAPQDAATGG
jgi:hypothetical protein